MKTKMVEELRKRVWAAEAQSRELAKEIDAARLAREILRAQMGRLAEVVRLAAAFVTEQSATLESSGLRCSASFAASRFDDLERSLQQLTGPTPPTEPAPGR